MSKNEFLNTLRECLYNEIPENEVNDNIRFYSEYIGDSASAIKSEEEVLNELGDARLIAKTIIEKYKMSTGEGKTADYTSEGSYSKSYTEDSNKAYSKKGFNVNYDEQEGWDVRFGRFKINTWYGKMLLGIVVAISLITVFVVGIYIFRLLLPLILLVVVLSIVIKMFK